MATWQKISWLKSNESSYMKPILFFILAVVIFSGLSIHAADAPEMRTWTDNTGKFSFEGSLVRSRGSEVMLRRDDDTLIRVPLSRLSQADRDFVSSLTSGLAEADDPLTGIAWYSTVEPAFAEAKRSRRPIMFMAAATQCGGVPGIF
jgi:hypothetical protein